MSQPAPLTDEQLNDIDARVTALDGLGLPGGTWTASPREEKSVLPPEMAHVVEDVLRTKHSLLRSSVGVFGDERHAEFAAHAPADVAALLAEVRRQRDELADAEAEKAKLIRWHGEDETALARMRGTIERLRAEVARVQANALLFAADRLEAVCPDGVAEVRLQLCQCDAADDLRVIATSKPSTASVPSSRAPEAPEPHTGGETAAGGRTEAATGTDRGEQ